LIAILRELWIYYGFNKEKLYPSSWRKSMDVIIMAVVIATCLFLRGEGSEFIYFQF
jgi:hypothetical protein